MEAEIQMSIFFGIDPGVGGAIAALPSISEFKYAFPRLKLKDATERDVAEWLVAQNISTSFAVIESVHSSPQMGVRSAFTFGRSYGFLRGVLAALAIPYVEVRPQKWQKAMECMTGGDKKVSKAKAQQLYPGEKVTHADADAMLLATYCRKHHEDLF
jgi:hypothetical protein